MSRKAFSLIELLVAVAVLAIMLVLLLSLISSASTLWKGTNEKIEAFQGARIAFDLMCRNLSRSTLNTYLDYDDPTNPSRYIRKSELKFLAGPTGADGLPGTPSSGQAMFFQVPGSYTKNKAAYGGLGDLLETCGYYVNFTTNSTIPPHVSSSKNPFRFRLMQLLTPAEENRIYDGGTGNQWFASKTGYSLPIAENIIALIVRLQDPSMTPMDVTSDYHYDSTQGATNQPQPITANQLPPIAQLTLVAIDEASAKRLENGSSVPQPIVSALNGKFQNTTRFSQDLSDLQQALTANRINFRIFTANIAISESKWSR